MLNIIANKLQLVGQEYETNNKYGKILYFPKFIEECKYTLGDDENGKQFSYRRNWEDLYLKRRWSSLKYDYCQHTEREETKWITGTTRL